MAAGFSPGPEGPVETPGAHLFYGFMRGMVVKGAVKWYFTVLWKNKVLIAVITMLLTALMLVVATRFVVLGLMYAVMALLTYKLLYLTPPSRSVRKSGRSRSGTTSR